MKAARWLVLGQMPPDASPASHLAAGPWCFAGKENEFPNWENDFLFAPEPFAEPSLPEMAAKAAQCLCARIIPKIAEKLSPESGAFPKVYWQTLLCPWAMDVAKQIVERSLRCEWLINAWGKESLRVPLLAEETSFDFLDERDFTLRGALGFKFNHWLFSRLLLKNWPAAWEKIWLEADMDFAGREQKILRRSRNWTREILRRAQLNLLFPRFKGMSVKQALKFSLALVHPCRQKDHSIDLDEYAGDWPGKIPWPDESLPIFTRCLPASVKKLGHGHPPKKTARPRLRAASIIAYEDAEYRRKLARWRSAGNRLAYAQHGGNYGQVKVVCDTEMVEYSQDVFFTWGWRDHGTAKGNFVPLPCPQLGEIANRWRPEAGGKLLFVGTEMAAFPYRLDSRPTPMQFLAYRRAKSDFFAELGREFRVRSMYRPYFDLPGTFEDAAWLLPRFPELELCKGPLGPHLLKCRLLVLDHHGTTMLEAFAANIPMILYWNREHWPLVPKCEELLDMLAEAGIWHGKADMAARKAREVWNNPAQWWNSPKIQAARKEYCSRQALHDSRGMDGLWIKTLEKL